MSGVSLDAERKRFSACQARAALAGHRLQRCEEECGKVTYFATAWGISRPFEKLSDVEVFTDLVTGTVSAKDPASA